MKKTFGQQLFDATSGVRLTSAEKARMRSAMVARMHPERVNVVELETSTVPAMHDYDTYRPRAKESRTSWDWLAGLRYVPATLALFGMVGAGVTFASEDAVPGDFLYPIKLNFTEELRGVVAFSDESRAQWETRRAERRLEEAEELASAGRLDASMSEQIALNFEKHTDTARGAIERLRESNPSGAAIALSSKFETALSAHHAILSHIAVGGTTGGTGEIAERVRVKAGEIAYMRAPVAEAATLSDAPSLMMATSATTASGTDPVPPVSSAVVSHVKTSAEAQVKSAERTLTSLTPALGGEARTRAEAEIAASKKFLADGTVALEAGDTGEAIRLYEQALMRARKIELFLQAEMRLNINLFGSTEVFGEEATTSAATTTNEEVAPEEETLPDLEEEGSEADLEEATPLPVGVDVEL